VKTDHFNIQLKSTVTLRYH